MVVASFVRFELMAEYERLEHWFGVAAPFALGVHAWSVGSVLAMTSILSSL